MNRVAVVAILILTGCASAGLAPSEPPPPTAAPTVATPAEPTTTVPPATPPTWPTTSPPPTSISFRSCDEARAAGAAPLHRGDPGYRSDLDRDGDGTACEATS